MSYNQGYKTKEHVGEYSESKAKSTPVAMVAPELKQNADVNTEITKTCAVSGCEDSKHLDAESFFRFPEDPNLRQIWTDLTGRNNWTPTDYSYICIQHFSVDCFTCNAENVMVLVDNAVPSLKLPRHVFEVEYIDETLDNEDDQYMDTDEYEEYEEFEEYEEEEKDEETDLTKPVNGDVRIPENTADTKNAATNIENAITNGIMETKPSATVKDTKKQITVDRADASAKVDKEIDIELLKLFTEVQKMQRQAVGLKNKLKSNARVRKRQNSFLKKMEEIIEQKKKILDQKRKKKAKILLSLREKLNEDANGLVLAMPLRQTEDLKNFALSIYKYSPQAYIYIRNTLRTMLPSTEALESWLSAGNEPSNPLTNSNLIKVTAEQTENELSCKVTIG